MYNKIAGDWYGTNSISHVLASLNQEFKPYDNFEILVCHTGFVSANDVIDKASIEVESDNTESEAQ